MTKKNKKIIKQTIEIKHSENNNFNTEKYLPYIITILFLVLAFIGIKNHEMWRDEYQAWMLAKESKSLLNLFHTTRFEGHPGLWFIILYIIQLFTNNIFFMQLVHILIATAGIFILVKYSPFTIFQKILLIFSYFFFFEYLLISRSYVLGLFFVLLFCMFYKDPKKNILLIAISLFFLANTSLYGFVITVALGFFLMIDLYFNKRSVFLEKKFIILFFSGLIIVFIGLGLSAMQMKTDPEGFFPIDWAKDFSFYRLKIISTSIFASYIPIPKLDTVEFWNKSIFWTDPIINDKNFGIFSFLAFCLFCFIFIYLYRKPVVAYFYLIATLGIMFIFYLIFLFHLLRFSGHLVIVLIAALWLYKIVNTSDQNNFLSKWSTKMQKPIGFLILFILIIQFFTGIYAYTKDLNYPFSNIPKASKYINNEKLNQEVLFGTTDYIISPLSYHINKAIYFPESDTAISYMIWNKKKKWGIKFDEIIGDAIKLTEKHNKIIVIMSFPFVYTDQAQGEKMFIEGFITNGIYAKLLDKFNKDCICLDEKYYIYKIEKK